METAHYEVLFTGLIFCKDDAARRRNAAAFETAIDQQVNAAATEGNIRRRLRSMKKGGP
jgi:hypothetical protein